MIDFSVETSLETSPCLKGVPSAFLVPKIVSPCETQSSEGSEQEAEERVNILTRSQLTFYEDLLPYYRKLTLHEINANSQNSR